MYVLLTRTEPNSVLKRGMLAGKFAILTCELVHVLLIFSRDRAECPRCFS